MSMRPKKPLAAASGDSRSVMQATLQYSVHYKDAYQCVHKEEGSAPCSLLHMACQKKHVHMNQHVEYDMAPDTDQDRRNATFVPSCLENRSAGRCFVASVPTRLNSSKIVRFLRCAIYVTPYSKPKEYSCA